MAEISDREAGGLSYIEQFTARDILIADGGHCQARGRPLMKAVNHHEGRAVFFRPRCKSWGCSHCGEVNKRLWTARAFYGAEQLAEAGLTFLTLTSSAKLGPEASVSVFSHAWDVLLKRARRSGSQGQYMLIPERHEDGRLHAHAVTTFNLGSRWWKDNAAETGLGYIAEEEPARTPGGAAWYVSKYVGKSLDVHDWPAYWRRVRTSRGWPRLPALETPDGWKFLRLARDESLQEVVRRLRRAGWIVKLADHRSAWDFVGQVWDEFKPL